MKPREIDQSLISTYVRGKRQVQILSLTGFLNANGVIIDRSTVERYYKRHWKEERWPRPMTLKESTRLTHDTRARQRDEQVLPLLRQGETVADAAKRLEVSESTIGVSRQRLIRKGEPIRRAPRTNHISTHEEILRLAAEGKTVAEIEQLVPTQERQITRVTSDHRRAVLEAMDAIRERELTTESTPDTRRVVQRTRVQARWAAGQQVNKITGHSGE